MCAFCVRRPPGMRRSGRQRGQRDGLRMIALPEEREDEPMLHYKAFSSAACNDDVVALEQLVNAWLASEQPYVHSMAQSSLGEHLVLSFLFEDDDAHDSQRATAVAVATPDIFA